MLSHLRAGSKRTKVIWLIVTVATVFTFLIGFSFFGSMGSDANLAARQSGTYGEINGEKITSDVWNAALASAIESYRQQYGQDPSERDLKSVEQRAWRTLVNEHLFAAEAKRAGIQVTDNDVIVGMRTSPPSVLYAQPAFQTDGKFDPQKYMQALGNPNIDWSPFEEQMRRELPVRRLQERLMSSIKLSEGELREAFHDRYDRLSAVIVNVPPADTGSAGSSDAEMQKIYDRFRTRLATPARTQLELLVIPVQYSDAEVKDATDRARVVYDRAVAGEDWDALVRDHSEGANATRGGVIDQFIPPAQLGPVGAQVAATPPGGIVPPYREGGQVIVFKVLDPARDSVARGAPAGTVKLAQMTIRLRPSSESLRAQYETAQGIAKRAKQVGLSKAATEKGLATEKTPPFDQNNLPPQLYIAPDCADWGLTAKQGEVSPVFSTGDVLIVAQVSLQHAPGPPTRAEVGDQLKQLADVDKRVQLAKPRADQVAQALQSGRTLEQAAQAAGLAAMPVSFSRQQPDPRLMVAPELQGALWAAKPGQVVGPFETLGGWYFGRLESVAAAPDSLYGDQLKGQLTTEILTRRQRTFFDGYLNMLRAKAKIVDNRRAFLNN